MANAASTLLLAAVLAGATALTGCTGPQAGRVAEGGNAGYRWVGAGPPGNFGADYGFCRRTVEYADRSQNAVSDTVGGMALPWDSSRAYTATTLGPSAAPTASLGTGDREVRQCLRSRGWAFEEESATPGAATTPGGEAPAAAGSSTP